jgi:diguanylate cyclase (GGDEF)-like protein
LTSPSSTAAQLTALVERLALLTAYRGVPSGGQSAETDVDTLVQRIEALIRDLDNNRTDLQEEVRLRTSELEAARRANLQLAELGSLLPASETLQDLDELIRQRLPEVFAGLSGALYTGSGDAFELQTSWGGLDVPTTMQAADCWALQFRVSHVVPGNVPAMSCRHVRRRTGDSICVPLYAHRDADAVGVLLIMDGGPTRGGGEGQLDGAKRQLAAAVGEQIGLTLANLELRRKLQFWALRDPLTGLYNRRFVDEWLEREISRSNRSGGTIGIVMMDMDHFKKVNDLHGHDAGDTLLLSLGGLISSTVRAGDIASRYGGEEFVLLLSDIDLDTLVQRTEILRERVARLQVRHRGVTLPPVTMSAGVAVYPLHGSSAGEVLLIADDALYAAKKAGRNRTYTPTNAGA